jgi:DNA-binding NarL/FixJ family response regulator
VDAGDPQATVVMAMLASALTLRGKGRQARPLFRELDERIQGLDPLTPQAQSLVISLTPRTWLEDFGPARRHLDKWVTAARAAGSPAYLGFPQAFGAELEFRVGRWDQALARAEEAAQSLEETGQLTPLTFALVMLATVEAGLGREDACRARVARASELASRLDVGSIRAYAGFALGFLEQGLGRAAAALAHLEPVAAFSRERGAIEPATVMWQPDLIEAHARLGRIDDARRALATLAEDAGRTGGCWARAATCRCRGLIDDDIDRHFGEALAWHARVEMPFELARTQLAYGARLRRAGRRTEARAQLEPALSAFEDLGAQPWARQAREEIAASGARLRPRRAARADDALSPRELQVAMAVAEGLTNREVAARLFLSEKTVERHLGSVYRRLGIRSRTQLARRFAQAADPR